ncbi:MAG: hypothetical protein KC656_00780, partial [Myxococcales bacterium]|nr:hypothetical protein [Myxococcales bacterium]
MIALLATALAHHGTATTQVAPTVGGSAAGQEASVSLGVSSLGFLRTYRGSQRAPDVGRVGVHLATLQTRVPLGRGWSLGASVPVGLIATTGAVRGGLGDASASLGRAGERLAGALTLSAPTGGRVQHPELSVTDVR